MPFPSPSVPHFACLDNFSQISTKLLLPGDFSWSLIPGERSLGCAHPILEVLSVLDCALREVRDCIPFLVEPGAGGPSGRALCAASEPPTGEELRSQVAWKGSDSSVPATSPSPSASPSAIFFPPSPLPHPPLQCPGRTECFLLLVTCDQSHLQLISTGCVFDPCPWLAHTTPAHSHLMGSAPAWQHPVSSPSHD